MPSIINASTSSGIVQTADTSGVLQLQANGVTVATIGPTGLSTQVGAPAFSAYNSSSTTINAGTYTKIILATEVFDTNSNFASSTFTPTVAGYYQINGAVSTNNPAGAVTSAIYKNGSINLKGSIIVPQSGTTLAQSTVSGLVFMNGSTDFVELYAIQTNGSSQTTNANSFDTYFNGAMVRSA